jgi:hypothetical protein
MKIENATRPQARRQFFRNLLGESVSLLQEMHGTPQLRLSELAHATDEVLRSIVPLIRTQPHFRLESRRLLLKNPETGLFEEICRFDDIQKFILDYFDGRHNLQEVASLAQNRFDLEAKVAFGCVKAFFLALVKAAVCRPDPAV